MLIREQVPGQGPAPSSVLGPEPKPLLQTALRQWLLCDPFSRKVSVELILLVILPYSSCFLLVCTTLLLFFSPQPGCLAGTPAQVSFQPHSPTPHSCLSLCVVLPASHFVPSSTSPERAEQVLFSAAPFLVASDLWVSLSITISKTLLGQVGANSSCLLPAAGNRVDF